MKFDIKEHISMQILNIIVEHDVVASHRIKNIEKTVASLIKIKPVSKNTDVSKPQFILYSRHLNALGISRDDVQQLQKFISNFTPQAADEDATSPSISISEHDDITFRVDPAELNRNILRSIVHQGNRYGYMGEQSGHSDINASKTVVVDFSSPNIAKPFHAGHLRSTILGNCLCNLYEALGHNVKRINYLGDWGTQFGILTVGFQKYGSVESLRKNPMAHLYEVYVKINADVASEKEHDLNTTHQLGMNAYRELEEGNAEYLSLWQQFRDYSIQEYKKIYNRLGIDFTEYHGEAMYRYKAKDVLDSLEESGLIQIDKNRGVKYVNVEAKDGTHQRAVVVKSDGTTLYLTRDIAAAIHRFQEYTFDKMHYVVEKGQSLHFNHLLGILRQMNLDWFDRLSTDVHIGFGRVEGMSTRRGDVVFLEDILDEAKVRMLDIMKVKETTKVYSNLEEVADVLGISSVIVADLKEKRMNNYRFSWQKAVSVKGDSGVFLQYAHARLTSIKRTCGLKLDDDFDHTCLIEDEAQRLVLHLARYEEVIEEAARTFELHAIVTYLFTLGHLVNTANRKLHVKEQEKDVGQARLWLFHCSRITLANGLRLLGLKPLDQM